MAKKPKAAPLSDLAREQCRAFYAIALRDHLARIDDAAIAVQTLTLLMYQYANATPAAQKETPFDLLVDCVEQAMEAIARVNVERDAAHDMAHHLNLDILPAYLPIEGGETRYDAFAQNVLAESPRDLDNRLFLMLRAARDGENARREAPAPTFAAFVEREHARGLARVMGRSDDETAHLRAASS